MDLILNSELLTAEKLKEFQDTILLHVLNQVKYSAEHGNPEITDPNDPNYGPIEGYNAKESNALQYIIDNKATPDDMPKLPPYLVFKNLIYLPSKDKFKFHIFQSKKGALVTSFGMSTTDVEHTPLAVSKAREKRVEAHLRAALNAYREVIERMMEKANGTLDENTKQALADLKENIVNEDALKAIEALKHVADGLGQKEFIAGIEEFKAGKSGELELEDKEAHDKAMTDLLKYTWATYTDIVNKILPEGLTMPEIKIDGLIIFQDTYKLEAMLQEIFKGISKTGIGTLIFTKLLMSANVFSMDDVKKKLTPRTAGVVDMLKPVLPDAMATLYIDEHM